MAHCGMAAATAGARPAVIARPKQFTILASPSIPLQANSLSIPGRIRSRALVIRGATSGGDGGQAAPIEIDPDEPRFLKGKKVGRRKGGFQGAIADASSKLQKSLVQTWAGREYGDGVGLVWRDDIKDRITLSAVFWDLVAEMLSPGSDITVAVLGCPSARPGQLSALADLVNAPDLPPWLRDQLPIEAIAPEGAPSPSIIIRPLGGTRSSPPPLPDPSVTPSEAEDHTRAWVSRVLVGLNVCPFTASSEKAGTGLEDLGIRPAVINYVTSTELTVPGVMRDFWIEVVGLLRATERERSTGLLCVPAMDGDWRQFRDLCSFLEASARASFLFLDVGLVWFHPDYVTGDALEYGHMHPSDSLKKYLAEFYPEEFDDPGREAAAVAKVGGWDALARANEYARRSPHATINTLRVHQVAVAERRRPGLSKQVYAANARKLAAVGEETLLQELVEERGGCPLGFGRGAGAGAGEGMGGDAEAPPKAPS